MSEENGLEKKERVALLFMLYGELLTPSTKQRIQDFYLEDYSLSEIALNEGVSRNAIFESLLHGVKKMEEMEKKLGLLERDERLLEQIQLLEGIVDDPKAKEILLSMKGELSNGI